MVGVIIPYVASIFYNVAEAFYAMLLATGAQTLWLRVIIMLLSYRFILRPIFGWASSAGSDYANKKRKE